ncbi:MAG: protein kinase [FCB group bacterium]|nr:protein kinase [FCB group bacterium]
MVNNEYDPEKTDILNNLTPGLKINHYTIVEKIGGGGMGEVYLADDSRLRRQVALKFLPVNCCHDKDLKERFQREARAAGTLNHPNILTIHDINEYKDRPYIVMEYFPGKSIKEMIRNEKFTPAKTINIAVHILNGLECAHRAGITHRDIKSDNIMVDDRGLVKIVDFGLARIEQEAGLTEKGSTLGTLSYMSPEQAQGQSADHRSDLFSLGVVLYEMIAGRLPFRGEHISAIINSILNDEPEDITHHAESVPPKLVDIINRLLEKTPEKRFQSADQVSEDIRGLTGVREIADFQNRSRVRSRLKPYFIMTGIFVVIVACLYYFQSSEKGDSRVLKRKMIAVLPFENVGSANDEYFTLGITDEIITHLAKLHNIGIISRSSVQHYLPGNVSYGEIGSDLGVEYVLEGSVRWDKSSDSVRVMVNTYLTVVKNGSQLWSESYHRVLNDIFSIQSDIARKLTEALNIELMVDEHESIERKPTTSVEAYAFYLQGNDYFNRRNWALAAELYQKAIELDSLFALAYAQLSRAHSLLFWWYDDRSETRLDLAKQAGEKALSIDPNLPEAHLAMGRYYYRGFLDYDRALDHYNKALEGNPNGSDLLFAIGSVNRRQGNWEQALEYFRNAVLLDPRAVSKLRNLSETYFYMGQYDSSLKVAEKVIALVPDSPSASALKAKIITLGLGQFDSAKKVLEKFPGFNDPEVFDLLFTNHVLSGDYDGALDLLIKARETDYFLSDSAYWHLQMGDVHRWSGKADQAYTAYDSARIILESTVQELPEEAAYRSMLAVAYAGLNRADDAIREGIKATTLCPVTRDALSGTSWRFNLMLTYVMLGQNEKAVAEINYLKSVPSQLTNIFLEKHPVFIEFRKSPIYSDSIIGID